MGTTGFGTGTPYEPLVRACTVDLTSEVDLFLIYARYFFPPELDEAGFRLSYGVYDSADGETAGMTFDLQSRIAFQRGLKHAHQRLANALNYYPLPMQIFDENQPYDVRAQTALKYGWLQSVGERSCTEVQLGVPLVADGDMLYGEVTMPADGSLSLSDLSAFEPNARAVRVPIAWSEMIDDTTARIYFFPASLVPSSVWRNCGAQKSPCDCAAVSGTDQLDAVDIYGAELDATSGVNVVHVACATRGSSTTCATITNARAGWILPSSCSCACSTTRANRALYSYVSGRWSVDTIPMDVIEAIVAIAAITLPEYTLCMNKTMPQHLRAYRELVPDLRGVPRQYGLQVAANVVTAYKQSRGI